MRISLKFLGNAFTILVLFLGTGAFLSLMMDHSDPATATEGSAVMQLVWSLIYVLVLARAASRYREIWRVARENKFILLLLVLALVSTAWSEDAGLTIRRALAVLGTTLFALDLAVRYPVREQIRLFEYALGLAVGISVFVELFYHGLVPTVDTAYPDAWNGIFVQKNDFARFVVLAAVIFLMRTRTGARKFLVGGATVAASVVLVLLCHSRTALVVLAAMLVLLRVFQLRRRGTRALIGGIAGVLILSALASMIADLDSMTSLLGRDATLTGRTNIWAMALESVAERPVLGYGYSAFWNVSEEADRISYTLHWKVPHAHNGFIDLTLQLGLVGLSLFIAVYIVSIRRSLALAHETAGQEAVWPLACLAFTLLYQVTESTIFVGNTLLWMIFVSTVSSLSVVRGVERASFAAPALEDVSSLAGNKEFA